MNISYHPISEKEVNEWYCDLKFESILNQVYYEIVKNGRRFNLDEERLKAYVAIIKISAQNAQKAQNFDEAHAYNVALVQGLFRKYFYLKEFSFSKLIEEKSYFERYTKKWNEFVNEDIKMTTNNHITGDKSGGVFIPNNKVIELLQDINKKGSVQDDLNAFFGPYVAVFVKALEFAKENNTGLLEASGIISKDVLNADQDLSNYVVDNCDEFSLRFVPVANEKSNSEKIEAKQEVVEEESEPIRKGNGILAPEKEVKKSLWKKLFG